MKSTFLFFQKNSFTFILLFFLITISCSKKEDQFNGVWKAIDRTSDFYWKFENDKLYLGHEHGFDKSGTDIKFFNTKNEDKYLMKVNTGKTEDRFYLLLKNDTLVVDLLSGDFSHSIYFKKVK